MRSVGSTLSTSDATAHLAKLAGDKAPARVVAQALRALPEEARPAALAFLVDLGYSKAELEA